MKKSIPFFLLMGVALLFTIVCDRKGASKNMRETYFGQNPPGMTPVLFALGIITTEYHEHSSPVYSTDGTEVYWSVFFNFWGPQVILTMKQEDGIWSEPEVASFSGQYGDGNPCFSFDGTKLFFESRRPVHRDSVYTGETDLWVVERIETGWGEPSHLGWSVNSNRWERGPCVSANGNLYFCSMREGGFGQTDIYYCEYDNGQYSSPINLGSKVNTRGYESFPFISSDESYLIYESATGDLFIHFRETDGEWSSAINMAEELDSSSPQDRFPRLSNDGKYLFFVSNRWLGNRYFDRPLSLKEVKTKASEISNGMGNVFWVDASVIEQLRPRKINH